jgi:hypothetical protein
MHELVDKLAVALAALLAISSLQASCHLLDPFH